LGESGLAEGFLGAEFFDVLDKGLVLKQSLCWIESYSMARSVWGFPSVSVVMAVLRCWVVRRSGTVAYTWVCVMLLFQGISGGIGHLLWGAGGSIMDFRVP
jgi:hypothetical protein